MSNSKPSVSQLLGFRKLPQNASTSGGSKPRRKAEDIEPEAADIALAPLAKYFGEGPVHQFATSLMVTPDIYQAFITDLSYLMRDLPRMNCSAAKLAEMKLFPTFELRALAANFQWNKIYVCPFNLTKLLIDSNGFVLLKDAGYSKTYSTTIDTVEIKFDSEDSVYSQASRLFVASEKVVAKTKFEIDAYDFNRLQIALMMSQYCEVSVSDTGKVSFIAKERPRPEPTICRLSDDVMNFCQEFATKILSTSLTPRHWYADKGQKLSIIYANLDMDMVKQLCEEIQVPSDNNNGFETSTFNYYETYLALRESPDSGWGHFVDRPDEAVFRQKMKEVLDDDVDTLFAAAKQTLTMSQGFISFNPPGRDYTEDLAMPCRVIHMSNKHWGYASKVTFFDQALKFLPAIPKQLFLFGQGSDKIGFGLEKAAKFNFFKYDCQASKVPMYIHATDASILKAVPNAHNSYPPRAMPPGSLQVMFEFPHDEKDYTKHLFDAYDRMEWRVDTPSVLACAHNLAMLDVFNSVIKFAEAKNLHVSTWRHPRCQNDYFFWYFTNGMGGFRGDAIRVEVGKRVNMMQQIVENNAWRNASLVTGWLKFNDREDEYIMKSIGVTHAIIHYAKRLSKKAGQAMASDRGYLGRIVASAESDTHEQDTGGDKDNNNNNNDNNPGAGGSHIPREPPRDPDRDNTDSGSEHDVPLTRNVIPIPPAEQESSGLPDDDAEMRTTSPMSDSGSPPVKKTKKPPVKKVSGVAAPKTTRAKQQKIG